jgi:hypothetical protein
MTISSREREQRLFDAVDNWQNIMPLEHQRKIYLLLLIE